MIVFRALSALLSYPCGDLRQALPEIADVVVRSSFIDTGEREGLLALIDDLANGELLEKEESYVELFDRGRSTSLNLFEHLHGDGRDRGAAMVELKRLYERSGFEQTGRELPDYLPVVLEYLSCRDRFEAREMLADCAHILEAIAKALIARSSAYAAVFQALLVISGMKPVDAASAIKAREPIENLERDWPEQPAFGESPTVP